MQRINQLLAKTYKHASLHCMPHWPQAIVGTLSRPCANVSGDCLYWIGRLDTRTTLDYVAGIREIIDVTPGGGFAARKYGPWPGGRDFSARCTD
jgi:hypothetical protein